MQELMSFHDVDIQWGNHDISWMGAAAGNLACICNVLRIAISYNSFDVLEDGYGINLRRFPCLRRGYIRMIRASVLCPGSWMKSLRRSGFRTGCQDAQGNRCHSVQGGRSYDHAPSGVWDGGPAPASGCGL